MNGTYLLWHRSESDWCDYDIVGESYYHPAHRRLLPPDWTGEGTEVRRNFELIAEPDNPHDPWAISVRADGHTVGYIPRSDAPEWAPVVRRVMASGLVPIVPGRMYAFMPREDLDWDGEREDLASSIQLNLDDPAGSLPINNPPAVPYTLLPRSSRVQVTKEKDHAGNLMPYVPAGGYGRLFVTLHERGRPDRVEVRVDDSAIGELSAKTGQHFLPLIQHFTRRNLVVACRADITRSALTAEVRISAVKAHEASPEVLNGDPITVPPLIAAVADPSRYDLSGAAGRTPVVAVRQQASSLPGAGWYDDPGNSNAIRYWTGTEWTHHTAPKPPYAR